MDLATLAVVFEAKTEKLSSGTDVVTQKIEFVGSVAEKITEKLSSLSGSVDLGKVVTNEDIAQAKLTLLESDVAQARAKVQTLENSANAGNAVTGLSEAQAQLTILEGKAQEAREKLLQMGQSAEEAGTEVEQGAEKGQRGLSGLASKMSEVAGGFANHIGGMVSGFGSGITHMIGNLVDFGSKLGMTVMGLQQLAQGAVSLASALLGPAASAEQVESSLVMFTGSAAKAKQEMQDLSSFAGHTPFETRSIDDAALKIQGVGISSDKVIPYIKALGDGLDAMGHTSAADLDEITTAFVKIQTTGHLTSGIMESFAVQGIDAWTSLSKYTGKSREELQKLVSSGAYPAKQAMDDLTNALEANPLYKGQMANDSASFSGALSTLKSNFDGVLASFGDPVIKALEPIFNNISISLSNPAFKNFADSIGKKIGDTFTSIGQALGKVDFKTIVSALSGSFGQKLKDIGTTISQVGTWIATSLMPALAKAAPGFEKLVSVGEKLSQAVLTPILNVIEAIIPPVIELAGNLAGGLASAITGVTNFFTQNETAMDALKATLLAFGVVLAAIIVPLIFTTLIPAMVAWAASMIPIVIETLLVAAPYLLVGAIVAAVIFGIIQAIKHWGEIVAWLQGVWNAISGFFVGLFNGIVNFFKQWGLTILEILMGPVGWIILFWKPISQFFQNLWSGIMGIFSVVGRWFGDRFNDAKNAIVRTFGNIGEWFHERWQLIVRVFTVVGAMFRAWFLAAWNNVTSIFKNAANWFHDHVWQPIVDKFTTVFNGLKNIAQGIWNGIAGGIKAAFNSVIGFINGAINNVNNVTGKIGIPAIPNIPYLASGGFIEPGSMAIAGDPGPNEELVYGGKAGATVFSHAQSLAMLNGGGGGASEIHVHNHNNNQIYLDGQEIADVVGAHIVDKWLNHGSVRSAA